MTSVRNRLQPLSGSRGLLFLVIALMVGACSPKLRPVPTPVKPPEAPPVKVVPPPAKPAAPKVSVISLLLPFGLDHIGSGSSYTDISLKKARIAADYYLGFKLALDSLTSYGYNYKLQLYDSRDEPELAHKLAYNPQIRTSDLIVGPVFPEDMKAFAAVLPSARKPIVSPLSPESPATFNNQNLVTVNPPLEYHAWCAAQYINDKIKPQSIFILQSGYSVDDSYITPFKKAIDSLSSHHIKVVAITLKHGQFGPLLAQLLKTKQNVFVVPSTDQAFLSVTLRSLDTLTKHYPVTLFGHPSWAHFTFLNSQLLQRLKTHVTAADHVDYKSAQTITFIRNYRNKYHTEPTPYAVKGFDEGLYFGQLLGADELKNMGQTDFTGLHNNFHFVKKTGMGWVNTHVNLLLYSNFELKQVE
jgi:ABC-type branched-subunit amino acid transport system substrate-binding protein